MSIFQKKESVIFNFLEAKFLSCESGYSHENEPVILMVIGSEINQHI